MSLNYVKDYNREIREWLLKVFALAASIPKNCLVRRTCPVCKTAESTFFANNDHLDYVRCSRCDLIYMNPALSADMVDKGFQGEDELLMEYFSLISSYKTGRSEKPDPVTDCKLKDIYAIKSSGRLLDIGCSFGDFLRKAAYFYEVEGVEVNPETAEIASREFVVYRKSLQELKLSQNYDIVTLHQVLYGLSDPVRLFVEIHKILKRDGLLYVNTPNAESYAMRLYRGKANHLYGYTTQNVFSYKSLQALAEKTGFRISTFRTEWLDIYLSDLMFFLDERKDFIHKRNTQIPGYEEHMKQEDELQRSLGLDLGERGNYLVAVLEKT